ncbi:MAG: hypothetical protein HY587_04840, partial [Candidatus Omnitrophica bacterium]|nr:hypothetical protein [Candidatus Omnitrophota bacterium]
MQIWQDKRFRPWLRFLSLTITTIFTLTSISWAGGENLLSQFSSIGKTGSNFSFEQNLLKELYIPDKIGRIQTLYQGSGEQVVVHIQDAHASADAQRNIAWILENLHKNYKLNLVNVEGDEGDIDTAMLAAFPHQGAKDILFNHLLQKGQITGPEFLAVTQRIPILIHGIDNLELYEKNRAAFILALEFRQKDEEKLYELRRSLSAIRSKIYSDELKEFTARYEGFKRDPKFVSGYVEYLIDQARKLNISTYDFRNVHDLITLTSLEKEIDFQRAESEIDTFADEIKSGLSQPVLTRFLSNTLRYKMNQLTPDSYFRYLARERSSFPMDSDRYANLRKFLDYTDTYNRIGPDLFTEITELESAIKNKLFRSEEEVKLDTFFRQLEILEKLFAFTMTKDDVLAFYSFRRQLKMTSFVEFIAEQNRLHNLKLPLPEKLDEIDRHIPMIEKFYQAALERDEVLVQNALSKMETRKQKLSVIITGGFHTAGIQHFLQEKNISHAVITPHISSIDEAGERALYEEAVQGKPTPIEAVLYEAYRMPHQSSLSDPRFQLAKASYFVHFNGGYRAHLQKIAEAGFDQAAKQIQIKPVFWTSVVLAQLNAIARSFFSEEIDLNQSFEQYWNLIHEVGLLAGDLNDKSERKKRKEDYSGLHSFLFGIDETGFPLRVGSSDVRVFRGPKLADGYIVMTASRGISVNEKANRVTQRLNIDDVPGNRFLSEIRINEVQMPGRTRPEELGISVFLVNEQTYAHITQLANKFHAAGAPRRPRGTAAPSGRPPLSQAASRPGIAGQDARPAHMGTTPQKDKHVTSPEFVRATGLMDRMNRSLFAIENVLSGIDEDAIATGIATKSDAGGLRRQLQSALGNIARQNRLVETNRSELMALYASLSAHERDAIQAGFGDLAKKRDELGKGVSALRTLLNDLAEKPVEPLAASGFGAKKPAAKPDDNSAQAIREALKVLRESIAETRSRTKEVLTEFENAQAKVNLVIAIRQQLTPVKSARDRAHKLISSPPGDLSVDQFFDMRRELNESSAGLDQARETLIENLANEFAGKMESVVLAAVQKAEGIRKPIDAEIARIQELIKLLPKTDETNAGALTDELQNITQEFNSVLASAIPAAKGAATYEAEFRTIVRNAMRSAQANSKSTAAELNKKWRGVKREGRFHAVQYQKAAAAPAQPLREASRTMRTLSWILRIGTAVAAIIFLWPFANLISVWLAGTIFHSVAVVWTSYFGIAATGFLISEIILYAARLSAQIITPLIFRQNARALDGIYDTIIQTGKNPTNRALPRPTPLSSQKEILAYIAEHIGEDPLPALNDIARNKGFESIFEVPKKDLWLIAREIDRSNENYHYAMHKKEIMEKKAPKQLLTQFYRHRHTQDGKKVAFHIALWRGFKAWFTALAHSPLGAAWAIISLPYHLAESFLLGYFIPKMLWIYGTRSNALMHNEIFRIAQYHLPEVEPARARQSIVVSLAWSLAQLFRHMFWDESAVVRGLTAFINKRTFLYLISGAGGYFLYALLPATFLAAPVPFIGTIGLFKFFTMSAYLSSVITVTALYLPRKVEQRQQELIGIQWKQDIASTTEVHINALSEETRKSIAALGDYLRHPKFLEAHHKVIESIRQKSPEEQAQAQAFMQERLLPLIEKKMLNLPNVADYAALREHYLPDAKGPPHHWWIAIPFIGSLLRWISSPLALKSFFDLIKNPLFWLELLAWNAPGMSLMLPLEIEYFLKGAAWIDTELGDIGGKYFEHINTDEEAMLKAAATRPTVHGKIDAMIDVAIADRRESPSEHDLLTFFVNDAHFKELSDAINIASAAAGEEIVGPPAPTAAEQFQSALEAEARKFKFLSIAAHAIEVDALNIAHDLGTALSPAQDVIKLRERAYEAIGSPEKLESMGMRDIQTLLGAHDFARAIEPAEQADKVRRTFFDTIDKIKRQFGIEKESVKKDQAKHPETKSFEFLAKTWKKITPYVSGGAVALQSYLPVLGHQAENLNELARVSGLALAAAADKGREISDEWQMGQKLRDAAKFIVFGMPVPASPLESLFDISPDTLSSDDVAHRIEEAVKARPDDSFARSVLPSEILELLRSSLQIEESSLTQEQQNQLIKWSEGISVLLNAKAPDLLAASTRELPPPPPEIPEPLNEAELSKHIETVLYQPADDDRSPRSIANGASRILLGKVSVVPFDGALDEIERAIKEFLDQRRSREQALLRVRPELTPLNLNSWANRVADSTQLYTWYSGIPDRILRDTNADGTLDAVIKAHIVSPADLATTIRLMYDARDAIGAGKAERRLEVLLDRIIRMPKRNDGLLYSAYDLKGKPTQNAIPDPAGTRAVIETVNRLAEGRTFEGSWYLRHINLNRLIRSAKRHLPDARDLNYVHYQLDGNKLTSDEKQVLESKIASALENAVSEESKRISESHTAAKPEIYVDHAGFRRDWTEALAGIIHETITKPPATPAADIEASTKVPEALAQRESRAKTKTPSKAVTPAAIRTVPAEDDEGVTRLQEWLESESEVVDKIKTDPRKKYIAEAARIIVESELTNRAREATEKGRDTLAVPFEQEELVDAWIFLLADEQRVINMTDDEYFAVVKDLANNFRKNAELTKPEAIPETLPSAPAIPPTVSKDLPTIGEMDSEAKRLLAAEDESRRIAAGDHVYTLTGLVDRAADYAAEVKLEDIRGKQIEKLAELYKPMLKAYLNAKFTPIQRPRFIPDPQKQGRDAQLPPKASPLVKIFERAFLPEAAQEIGSMISSPKETIGKMGARLKAVTSEPPAKPVREKSAKEKQITELLALHLTKGLPPFLAGILDFREQQGEANVIPALSRGRHAFHSSRGVPPRIAGQDVWPTQLGLAMTTPSLVTTHGTSAIGSSQSLSSYLASDLAVKPFTAFQMPITPPFAPALSSVTAQAPSSALAATESGAVAGGGDIPIPGVDFVPATWAFFVQIPSVIEFFDIDISRFDANQDGVLQSDEITDTNNDGQINEADLLPLTNQIVGEGEVNFFLTEAQVIDDDGDGINDRLLINLSPTFSAFTDAAQFFDNANAIFDMLTTAFNTETTKRDIFNQDSILNGIFSYFAENIDEVLKGMFTEDENGRLAFTSLLGVTRADFFTNLTFLDANSGFQQMFNPIDQELLNIFLRNPDLAGVFSFFSTRMRDVDGDGDPDFIFTTQPGGEPQPFAIGQFNINVASSFAQLAERFEGVELLLRLLNDDETLFRPPFADATLFFNALNFISNLPEFNALMDPNAPPVIDELNMFNLFLRGAGLDTRATPEQSHRASAILAYIASQAQRAEVIRDANGNVTGYVLRFLNADGTPFDAPAVVNARDFFLLHTLIANTTGFQRLIQSNVAIFNEMTFAQIIEQAGSDDPNIRSRNLAYLGWLSGTLQHSFVTQTDAQGNVTGWKIRFFETNPDGSIKQDEDGNPIPFAGFPTMDGNIAFSLLLAISHTDAVIRLVDSNVPIVSGLTFRDIITAAGDDANPALQSKALAYLGFLTNTVQHSLVTERDADGNVTGWKIRFFETNPDGSTKLDADGNPIPFPGAPEIDGPEWAALTLAISHTDSFTKLSSSNTAILGDKTFLDILADAGSKDTT